MQVKDIMSSRPAYISKETSLQETAQKMEELDCGFLPVGDGDKLDGVLTDRDIVLRAVAKGKDLKNTTAGDMLTDRVLYCFEEDSVEEAARNMREQQVYRLVVLNNSQEKRLRGVVSLGDISRKGQYDALVGETAEEISKASA
ncbi:MAG: CBS domain-containing protein [Pseudomonadota bacterium]